MVRRSSPTSRGTTYWFPFFFLFSYVLGISSAHAHVFRTVVKKCNKGNNKLDPRVYAAFPLGGECRFDAGCVFAI